MLIGTSFKMNKTRHEARAWIKEVCANLPKLADDDKVFVIPPFTAIETVISETANTTFFSWGTKCPSRKTRCIYR